MSTRPATRSTADAVDAWVKEHWNPEITLREWWRRLADAGYSQPTWPVGFGGLGCDGRTAREITSALAAHAVIAPPVGIGPSMGGPTLLEHGDDDQRQHARAIADGREAMCQLFSEPEAGSDLAGVRTTATLDGDSYVVDGQKVWNSSADVADWGLLLARTDPDAAKHAGLSFFLIDMRQPGVEARPLRTMDGEAIFCEVFLDGARTPASNVVGGLGNGWKVATTMLAHERKMAASGSPRGLITVAAGAAGGNLDRRVGDLLAAAEREAITRRAPLINSPRTLIRLAQERGVIRPTRRQDEPGAGAGTTRAQRGSHRRAQAPDLTAPPGHDERARPAPSDTQHGAGGDPTLRDELARYYIRAEVYRLTNLRARARAATGRPGPEASVAKLALSGLARTSRDLGLRIVGADGLLVGPEAASGGAVQHAALSAPGVSLGGGTDEIQRNVIGERALGLPREP